MYLEPVGANEAATLPCDHLGRLAATTTLLYLAGMGQSQSQLREEEEYQRKRVEWLQPIESRGTRKFSQETRASDLMCLERLVDRYRKVLRNTIDQKEEFWLEVVFTKFASSPGYWNESDLIAFLSLSFPEPSTQLLREAGPSLYRLILRVGSYPYHQDPVHELDLATLRTAIIILCRKDEHRLCYETIHSDEEDSTARLQRRYLRLLFQCLAPTPGLNKEQKADSDDEDILEAICVISMKRLLRHPNNPKIATPAPHPLPSSIPSSHAKALEGRLSRADLQVLIRLCLACQLCWNGSGPEHVVASPSNGFDIAADAVLSAFNLDQDEKCTWEDFERIMANQEFGLSAAMLRILGSLTQKPRMIDQDIFASLFAADAAKLLKSKYKSVESQVSVLEGILNLPLLCQVAMFFPDDVPLDKAKMVASKKSEPKLDPAIKTVFQRPSSGLLLLICGNACYDGNPSLQDETIVCGIYIPPENQPSDINIGKPAVFQCRPKQLIWPGSINREESSLRGSHISDNLVLRVDTLVGGSAELHVDILLHNGSLVSPVDGVTGAHDRLNFFISDLEVLDITPDLR